MRKDNGEVTGKGVKGHKTGSSACNRPAGWQDSSEDCMENDLPWNCMENDLPSDGVNAFSESK